MEQSKEPGVMFDYDPKLTKDLAWQGAMERHAATTEYNTRRALNAQRFIAWCLFLFMVFVCFVSVWLVHEIASVLSAVSHT